MFYVHNNPGEEAQRSYAHALSLCLVIQPSMRVTLLGVCLRVTVNEKPLLTIKKRVKSPINSKQAGGGEIVDPLPPLVVFALALPFLTQLTKHLLTFIDGKKASQCLKHQKKLFCFLSNRSKKHFKKPSKMDEKICVTS